MNTLAEDTWEVLGDSYAFLGNSLLQPMNQTPSIGLDPVFWQEFPTVFSGDKLVSGLKKLHSYALAAQLLDEKRAIEKAAVEHTRLFIGPPSPAAPPWETMQKNKNVTVGFGEATFQMRQILREAGLEMSNQNNQYEDHIGIELLYLSETCRRFAECENIENEVDKITTFINEHPLSWIGILREKVEASFPDGYVSGLLQLAEGILVWHKEALSSS